jgi:hypothetical protein
VAPIIVGVMVVGLAMVLGYVLLGGQLGGLAVQIAPTPTPSPVPVAEPCSVQAEAFSAATVALLDDWDDANALAGSTPRMSLGPAIAELQQIRRDVGDLDAPPCAQRVHTLLVDYMDVVIEGYLAFLADEGDSAVNSAMRRADAALDTFTTEYAKLMAGQPPYD